MLVPGPDCSLNGPDYANACDCFALKTKVLKLLGRADNSLGGSWHSLFYAYALVGVSVASFRLRTDVSG